MNILFETPIPIIVVFLALLTLSVPSIEKKKWALVTKYLLIIFFGYYALTVHSAVIKKSEVGSKKQEAYLVSQFTENISNLVSSGDTAKAQVLLQKFSKEYPAISGHNEMATEFLNSLVAESAANH